MLQSPFLCAASVATVAVALTLIGFFAIIVVNIQLMTRDWSREVQVIAYLDVVPAESSLKGLIEEIAGHDHVQGVTYVSRQEAYERFAERLSQDADLLAGLEADFLPASLEISLREEFRTAEGVSTLVAALKQKKALSDLRYGQEWLERFEAFVRLLKVAGAVLGGFLLFAALFIVANTIKLTLYARRDELEIMALVGATPLFIKLPFLLEGALQGAVGGILALGGTFFLFHLFLQEGMSAVLLATGTSHIAFLPGFYQLAIVAGGALLGFAGSLVSLRKFVRL